MKVKDVGETRRVDPSGAAESRRTRTDASPVAADDKVTVESKDEVAAAVDAARQAAGQGRAVRLEEIEAAIRSGTFQPDPQRIAQRILDDAAVTVMLQSMMKR